MDKLNLTKNQFAVGKAEYSTGIVLKNDGSFYFKSDNQTDAFELFDTLEEAKNFVIEKVDKNPTIECYITNSNNQTVFIYDKNGERRIN